MAKRSSINRAAADEQCGHAKALAAAIENYADNGALLIGRERRYHRRTAEQV